MQRKKSGVGPSPIVSPLLTLPSDTLSHLNVQDEDDVSLLPRRSLGRAHRRQEGAPRSGDR